MASSSPIHHLSSIIHPFWFCLERLSGLSGVPLTWRQCLGEHFDCFSPSFLQLRPEPAVRYPCDNCSCFHDVIIDPTLNSKLKTLNSAVTAVCRCDPLACSPLMLTRDDIQIWELSWSKLTRALCRAFGLEPKTPGLSLFQTRQIGSWSADAVPAL